MTLLSSFSLSSRKNTTTRKHSGRCVPPTFLFGGGGYTPSRRSPHKDHNPARTTPSPRTTPIGPQLPRITPLPMDRQAPVKILPCPKTSFAGGNNAKTFLLHFRHLGYENVTLDPDVVGVAFRNLINVDAFGGESIVSGCNPLPLYV